MNVQQRYSLLDNSRFYILVFSFLLSVLVFAWLRLHIDSDQLLSIRTQQAYGFICLAYWYAALIISPLGHVIGKHRMKHIEFARRAIGVSAFYFALLHTAIALYGQLGGVSQIQLLPDLFKLSLLGGLVALIILAAMAATSLDIAIRVMTYRRWKWLHRLVYVAGVLAILHVWTIGTHLAYSSVQIACFVALTVLSGLEVLRIARQTGKRLELARAETAVAAGAVWIVILVVIASLPALVQNYHSRHTGHEYAHSQELK